MALQAAPGQTANALALQFQIAVRGGIVLAKALDDPAAARSAFGHLERDLRLVFERSAPDA